MRTPRLALAVLALTVATGCGADSDGEGGDEPTTAGALAHVAAEHTSTPDRTAAMEQEDVTSLFGDGGVGAELRYGSDGEYDGDMLAVVVGRGLDRAHLDCDAEVNASYDGCAPVEDGLLLWQEEEPEEDPGTLTLVVEKDGSVVLVGYAGPTITGDPRELDLPIDVDDLVAIATDPRVDLTTSREAVKGGEALVS